ncbi:hypothetical protein ACFYUR_18905 [Micromonospora haikouensis]|uniref:hypothetical protein n=1 Tax=Micromonospora haikouensis TaxID=686309 RepID=UPI0036C71796
MTVDNLPARRTAPRAVAVITTAKPAQTTPPASTGNYLPAFRLATALAIVSFAVAVLSAASYLADRSEQAALCAGVAGALLVVALVEWCRRRT